MQLPIVYAGRTGAVLVPGSAVPPLAATRVLAGPVALARPAPVLQREAGAAAPVNTDLADKQLHNLGTAAPAMKIVLHSLYLSTGYEI